MKHDPLKQFIALRAALTQERSRLETRLAEINRALEVAAPRAERASRAENSMSLRAAVSHVTKAQPLTKAEILKAIAKLGYKFTARNPVNSLNADVAKQIQRSHEASLRPPGNAPIGG